MYTHFLGAGDPVPVISGPVRHLDGQTYTPGASHIFCFIVLPPSPVLVIHEKFLIVLDRFVHCDIYPVINHSLYWTLYMKSRVIHFDVLLFHISSFSLFLVSSFSLCTFTLKSRLYVSWSDIKRNVSFSTSKISTCEWWAGLYDALLFTATLNTQSCCWLSRFFLWAMNTILKKFR